MNEPPSSVEASSSGVRTASVAAGPGLPNNTTVCAASALSKASHFPGAPAGTLAVTFADGGSHAFGATRSSIAFAESASTSPTSTKVVLPGDQCAAWNCLRSSALVASTPATVPSSR